MTFIVDDALVYLGRAVKPDVWSFVKTQCAFIDRRFQLQHGGFISEEF